MDTEQKWGEDAVGVGRRREPAPQEPPRPRPPRGRLPMPPPRVLLAIVGGIVALVALISVLDGGGASPPAPIRSADPAPPIVVEPPKPARRREPRSATDPVLKRQPKGQLEQRDREPKASVPAHELAAPKAVEVAPEPPPVPPAEVVPPPPSTPTPTAVEFGL